MKTLRLKSWVVVNGDGLPLFVSFSKSSARGLAESSLTMAWTQIVRTEKYRLVKAVVEMPDTYNPKAE